MYISHPLSTSLGGTPTCSASTRRVTCRSWCEPRRRRRYRRYAAQCRRVSSPRPVWRRLFGTPLAPLHSSACTSYTHSMINSKVHERYDSTSLRACVTASYQIHLAIDCDMKRVLVNMLIAETCLVWLFMHTGRFISSIFINGTFFLFSMFSSNTRTRYIQSSRLVVIIYRYFYDFAVVGGELYSEWKLQCPALCQCSECQRSLHCVLHA